MATLAARSRRLLPLALAAALLALAPTLDAQTDSTALPGDDEAIRHVLNRLGFGPAPGDLERVRQLGLERYIDQQLHPERLDDGALEARLATFTTLNMSSRQLAEEFFIPAQEMRRQQQQAAGRAETQMTPAPGDAAPAPARPALPQAARGAQQGVQRVAAELMQARLLRAIESERQLQEVLVDFWFNHFNVFIGKNMVRQYLTEYEREVIRPHVFGSFRDLLGAVAKSPAMLLYLDNWQSSAPAGQGDNSDIERRLNDSRLSPAARQRLQQRLQQMRQQPRPTRGLNENYARELLELHTLGVDGGYGQEDVVGLARILTGWTIDQPRQGGAFVFRAAMHDAGTKTLLGRTFGPSGQAEGEFALDLLASHPSTAKHIATKLAKRFVADEPPASVVERAAGVFLETKGDLRAVVRSIVTSPEFFADDARRAKVKTPLEFVVSAVRATGASVTNAQPLVAALQTLGMPLYGAQPPTGYGTSASDWVNTGALLGRMNFAVDLVAGGRNLQMGARGQGPNAGAGAATRPNAARRSQAGPIRIDVATLAPGTDDEAQGKAIDALLGGVASDATRQTLARATSSQQLVALTLGSPEFQRR
jgi:uncharacterized protein (DUF1800 family)